MGHNNLDIKLDKILNEIREFHKKDYVTAKEHDLNLKNLKNNLENNVKDNYTKNSVFWAWIACGGVLITLINLLIHCLIHSK